MLLKWIKLPSGFVVLRSCVLDVTFGCFFVNYSPLLLPDPAPQGQGCEAVVPHTPTQSRCPCLQHHCHHLRDALSNASPQCAQISHYGQNLDKRAKPKK